MRDTLRIRSSCFDAEISSATRQEHHEKFEDIPTSENTKQEIGRVQNPPRRLQILFAPFAFSAAKFPIRTGPVATGPYFVMLYCYPKTNTNMFVIEVKGT